MPSFPPVREIRRHLRLLAAGFLLTQLPAVALLVLGPRQSMLAFVGYFLASLASGLGLVTMSLAWYLRIERIVGLVRGYAEDGFLPKGAGEAGESEERVKASLATLDRVVRSLEKDAACDPLTGILNRRTSAVRLEGDLARSRRSGVPFSVGIFDLDDLKTINDSYGHAAGDEALRHLAHVLESVTREGDWVARWGGDEFLVGFWSAEGEAAMVAAERALAKLAEEPAMLGDRAIRLGASVGIGQAQSEDDATQLFSRADAALFEAKRTGRGRVSRA